MASLTLEGNTLGEKHKHFNKLVHDAVANQQANLSKINYDDNDIDNLFKIHTACRTKNVDYIMEVLKCDDMLYVSTAIKHSTWLVTDQEYAHIVNPDYLHAQLFPHMLTKAINKMLLHIRLHLKDEKRVEIFYNYCKDKLNRNEAEKWLLNCSIPFIVNVMQSKQQISRQTYIRLCRRSIKFLPHYTKIENQWRCLQSVLFLLNSNTEEYLNYLETSTTKDPNNMLTFGKKHTEIIMKKYPDRILDNFEKYIAYVDDISIVAKYIKRENIKEFILKNFQNKNTRDYFHNYNNLKHFINKMPEEERFEFVKKTYIDKFEDPSFASENWKCGSIDYSYRPSSSIKVYEWYQHAPFSVALVKLKKFICAETSPAERCAMLSLLISCANHNMQNIKTVLQYYYDKHRNEPFRFKVQFVNNVITRTSTHEFDNEAWDILDKLFHSLEVYIESNNDVQLCLQSIVVYKVTHNKNIPAIIETKLKFDTFEKFQTKLNSTQKNQVFHYLLTFTMDKINSIKVIKKTDFEMSVNLLRKVFDLIISWKKDKTEYTYIRQKIQEIIKIKKLNSWQTDLSCLYKTTKSLRRQLFEESMILLPSEKVFLNALKHEPALLDRYSEELDAIRTNDKEKLRYLHYKLRIYWPQTFAQKWINFYLKNLDNNTSHKSLIRNLMILLPKSEILKLAKKHVPENTKINWSEIDQMALSLSKNIAKHLYMARPSTSLDTVLWYAKGDYLQYTVPSLNSVLHNMSKAKSRDYIPKLLEAPVSLQKYGVHLAYMKLEHGELKSLFSDIWQTTNNVSIRTLLFNYTFKLLCTVKESNVASDLWEVLKIFMSNLTPNENKDIYSNLGKAKSVHPCVQGDFFMKSYAFMLSLPPAVNCHAQKQDLMAYAPNVMDLLDSDFVIEKLISPGMEKITKRGSDYIHVMSSFVLHGKTEVEQCERFKNVLVPILENDIASWEHVEEKEFVVKDNVEELLSAFVWDMRKFLILRKIIAPVKLFTEITTFIKQKMPIKENYVRYTALRLTTEYVKLVAKYEDMLCDTSLDKILTNGLLDSWFPDEVEEVWKELHFKLSPELGPIIVKHLKEDVEKYFPSIIELFREALNNVFRYLSFNYYFMEMETLKYMILNEDYIPCYIIVCKQLPKYGNEEDIKKRLEVREILSAHPSEEVQMHYLKALGGVTDALP